MEKKLSTHTSYIIFMTTTLFEQQIALCFYLKLANGSTHGDENMEKKLSTRDYYS
jgi:hypothetical protein